jgi:hypothetical protein
MPRADSMQRDVKSFRCDPSSRQTTFKQQALAKPGNLQRVFRSRQQRKKQEIQLWTWLKSRKEKLPFKHVTHR